MSLGYAFDSICNVYRSESWVFTQKNELCFAAVTYANLGKLSLHGPSLEILCQVEAY